MTDPYLDPERSTDERAADLLSRMTLEEKAGLLFHTMALVSPGGALTGAFEPLALPATEELVVDGHLNHFNIVGGPSPVEIAQWHNRVQELAESTRLRIPVTVSTDPRHAFTRNLGTGARTDGFSSWPESVGFAALRDPALVETFADTVRREYLAVGIRVALHPQADLATEPRWSRIAGTYGEDVETVCELTAAQVRGLQGPHFGSASVSTTTKHFPGGGPQRDGEDPHFSYGIEQDYPGGQGEAHLAPFVAAIAAGTRQIMPSYGVPTWPDGEGVAFCFDRSVITDLLRDRLGFDGIVCTDWGVLSDVELMGQPMPARAWGLEHLTPAERIVRALDAGVDQFGGEHRPALVVELVHRGVVSEARVDTSALRLLREKFALGLFEGRRVDVDAVAELVGRPDDVAAGRRAQGRALTVAVDRIGLPLAPGTAVFVDGLDPTAFADAQVVTDRTEADVTILRVDAPYEARSGGFESMFHAGSIELDAAAATALAATIAAGPTVLVVDLDRAAVLVPHLDAHAVICAFGASDTAVADGLFGRTPMDGRLPFDLPSSEAAVAASRTDVAFDTDQPLLRFGFRAQR